MFLERPGLCQAPHYIDNIKSIHLKKINSLLYRLLRTAVRDYAQKVPRDELTALCKRATPLQWLRFITASKVIKIYRDQQPMPLLNNLNDNYFEEPRKAGIDYFFDRSCKMVGKQKLQNRLFFMQNIAEPWNVPIKKLSDDETRVCMEKTVFPLEVYNRE